jgi:YD repeat-containing protein
VAVPSLFTAKSRTYKNPRGVYTTTLFGETVNVQEANGTWKPISASASAGSAPAGAKPAGGVTPNASVSSTASHDCALASNSPTTSICNATTDTVGYDGTNTDNSLVEFETKTALPAGANVLNAQLGMYLASASTSTAVSVSAYAATKPWTLSATWNTYDGTNAWSSPGGDFSTTNAVVNPSVTTPAGWKYWYPTQIAQEWVNGTLTNDGLLLADTTQKTTKDMLSFNSLDASSNKPFLTIAWTPRGQEDPTVYTMQPFPTDAGSTTKVNLASGDLFVNSNDLSVSSAGPPLLAEHNYDSLNTEGGSVNPWYSLPGAEVYPDGSVGIGINRYDYAVFIRQPNGTFLTPRSIDATLCAVNGSTCTGNASDGSSAAYALTFNHNGNGPLYQQSYKIDFAANGGILSDADTAGNTITYHYGSFGIASITDSHGHTFTRSFHELKGGFHVTSAWTESGTGKREVKYAYNASDQLEAYTDAEGHKTKYAYDEEGELKEVTDPAGHVTKLTYESAHRIKTVTGPEVNGLHPTWSYTYYEVGKAPAPCTSSQKATVLTETNGSEEPPLTYCANVFDEVEGVFGYPATGQPGWYVLEDEALSESVNASVNVATGNLFITSEDVAPEAEDHSMALNRYYNSQATQTRGSLSGRWRWGTGPDIFLTDYGAKVVIHGPGGYYAVLNRTMPGGSYTGPEEYEGTLTKNPDGTYTLVNEARPTYNFNSLGVLTSETDREGSIFTVGDATVSGQSLLHELRPATGKALEVRYDTTPHVTESADPASRLRHYEYDASGRAKTYTDASGAKTEYGYDATGHLNKIVTPEGTETFTTTNSKVSEVVVSRPEGETTSETFSYQGPTSPCNPATDAGKTIVTSMPSESTETFCYDAQGRFTGPTTAEEAEEEAPGEPEEVSEACKEAPELPAGDCALEEAAPEPPLDLPQEDHGLADSHWLLNRPGATEPFNYLADPNINALKIHVYRRTIPWNLISEAEHQEKGETNNPGALAKLEDVEEWIKVVEEKGAVPYISFDALCTAGRQAEKDASGPAGWDAPGNVGAAGEKVDDHFCAEAPTVSQYKAAVEKFLYPTPPTEKTHGHAILASVHYFTPWNEPNLRPFNSSGERKKPTWSPTEAVYQYQNPEKLEGRSQIAPNGAYLAARYWRALSDLCVKREGETKQGCYVAAGEFIDSDMPNARVGAGGAYLTQYLKGLEGKTPYRWAWHAYHDGAHAGETRYTGRRRAKWWTAFKTFQGRLDKAMKLKKSRYPEPDIWLTEQGVVLAEGGFTTPSWGTGRAGRTIKAYVNEGNYSLTEVKGPSGHPQVKRFFYYNAEGNPQFDSGLLEASVMPNVKLEGGRMVPAGRRHPARAPRELFNIYRKMTPGHR